MNIVIAWVLVSWMPSSSPSLTYSPLIASYESCDSLRRQLEQYVRHTNSIKSICLGIEVTK